MHVWTHHRCRFPLPPKHRFPVDKYARLAERVLAEGLVAPDEVHEPAAIGWDALAAVHDADLLARIRDGGLSLREERGLGLPWSPQLVERARRTTSGTLHAARHALRHSVAMNLGGGTHHAGRDFARGYCLFNDVAVDARPPAARQVAAARAWSSTATSTRATAPRRLLGRDPDAFTLSLHGARNYPFKRIPSDLDVDLPTGTGDAAYLARWRTRSTGARRAAADVAFYLAGADPWEGDRLGRLALTKAGLRARDELVLDRLLATGAAVCVVLAGGYAPDVEDTVDINAATAAAVAARRRRPKLTSAPGGVVITGARGLCTAEVGVRFPSPPSVIASSGFRFVARPPVGEDLAGAEHGVGDSRERFAFVARVSAQELVGGGLTDVVALHEHALGALDDGALPCARLELADALGQRAELLPARVREPQGVRDRVLVQRRSVHDDAALGRLRDELVVRVVERRDDRDAAGSAERVEEIERVPDVLVHADDGDVGLLALGGGCHVGHTHLARDGHVARSPHELVQRLDDLGALVAAVGDQDAKSRQVRHEAPACCTRRPRATLAVARPRPPWRPRSAPTAPSPCTRSRCGGAEPMKHEISGAAASGARPAAEVLIYERILPAVPATVARIRRVDDVLACLDVATGRRDDIALVVTEAATNAVLHGYVDVDAGPLYAAAWCRLARCS